MTATDAQIGTITAYNTAIFNLTGYGRIVPRDEMPAFTADQADAVIPILKTALINAKADLVKGNPTPGTEEE